MAVDWPGRIAEIERQLHAPEPQKRVEAVERLEVLDAPAADPLLLGALADQSDDVRVRAARALGRRRVAAAEPTLMRWLGEPEPKLRAAAADALGSLCRGAPCAKSAGGALVRVLGDAESEVRQVTVSALAHLEAREAVPALTGRLDDENLAVRRGAATALGD